MIDLLERYRQTLAACAPDVLVRAVVPRDAPRNVVAIGKCAAGLLDGVAQELDIARAFVAMPRGYPLPSTQADVAIGGHPSMTDESFDAGRRLVAFVEECDDVLFLMSGGGSACVELPLAPWFDERDLADANEALVASGLAIGDINIVRKHLSAIKGGRLAQRVRGRIVTLVYSDVSRDALADVASGPTLPDVTTNADAAEIASRAGLHRIVTKLRNEALPETVTRIAGSRVLLVADNTTLLDAAGGDVKLTIETDVEVAARQLFAAAQSLQPGELLVAGGEPTVMRRGDGRGGRCTELAARFALLANAAGDTRLHALFGSSDGVDGTSGVAGVFLRGVPPFDAAWAEAELARSNSLVVAEGVGEAIRIPATGNNLRDVYLLARG
jgi:hydroxypyruvate reductase